MNLEKAKKRILKKVNMGFHGYPVIAITYHGPSATLATRVSINFIAEEGAEPLTETFSTETDIREDESIQSTIVKIIERANAQSVSVDESVVVGA